MVEPEIKFAKADFITEEPLKSNLLKFNNGFSTIDSKGKYYKKKTGIRDSKTQPKAVCSQREKIPITLNTLLITGIDSSQVATYNNFKNNLNQFKVRNFE